MDSATKEVLLNLLKNLKIATEHSYQTWEAQWQMHSALLAMFPERYEQLYNDSASHPRFETLTYWRDSQLRQLDAAIQLVGSWE
jgi:hypothetical protein